MLGWPAPGTVCAGLVAACARRHKRRAFPRCAVPRRALPQSLGVRDADGTLTSCDAVFVRQHDAGGTYASYGATMCDNARR